LVLTKSSLTARELRSATADGGIDLAEQRGQALDTLLSAGDLEAECVLVAVEGACGALQAGQLRVGLCLATISGLPAVRALTSL
jgi:hypothetical protein